MGLTSKAQCVIHVNGCKVLFVSLNWSNVHKHCQQDDLGSLQVLPSHINYTSTFVYKLNKTDGQNAKNTIHVKRNDFTWKASLNYIVINYQFPLLCRKKCVYVFICVWQWSRHCYHPLLSFKRPQFMRSPWWPFSANRYTLIQAHTNKYTSPVRHIIYITSIIDGLCFLN